jgi:hypothetical protein
MNELPVGGTHEPSGLILFVGFLDSLGGEEGRGLIAFNRRHVMKKNLVFSCLE